MELAADSTSEGAGWLLQGTGRQRLVVCERTGTWAVALRRELDERVRVHETRSLGQCWQVLADAPASFLVVELTDDNVDALLERLIWHQRDFPLARLAVVAERGLAAYEWLVREAGAVHFCCSPRRLKPLADLACRHLELIPSARQTLVERIWAELPWGEE